MKPPTHLPITTFEEPIGIDTRFCLPEPVHLVLDKKSRSWSGNDFKVKDADGRVLLACEGKANLALTKIISDAQGAEVYTVDTNPSSSSRRTTIHTRQGKDVGLIYWDYNSLKVSYKLKGTFVDQTTHDTKTLELRGKLSQRAQVFFDNEVVAEVWKAKWLTCDLQIEVAPNVDYALIAIICISFVDLVNLQM
ncbi:hypothetical protein IAR55_005571 [Kwoniella newhampshirensis]|uniref:Tubby C-terminal-like domain-containing protein n=1 Tax=Kwoniella newhampshirensis TaxID=1651941 RepID=A0AAW0YHQ3_9TREE